MDSISNQQAPPPSVNVDAHSYVLNPYEQEVCSELKTSLLIYDGILKIIAKPKVELGAFCQQVKKELQQDGYEVLYFGIPPDSPDTMTNLIRICLQLDKHGNFTRVLTEYLSEQKRKNKKLVIIFNQAELLDRASLLCVRMLSNIQDGTHGLISVIICGNEELNAVLSTPALRTVAYYINHSFLIYPWLELELHPQPVPNEKLFPVINWPRFSMGFGVLFIIGSTIFIPRSLIGDTVKEYVLKPRANTEAIGTELGLENSSHLLAFNSTQSPTPNNPQGSITAGVLIRTPILKNNEPDIFINPITVNASDETDKVLAIALNEELSARVQLWINAWQQQDPQLYFSYYQKGIVLSEFSSNFNWQESRRNRILSPESIEINFDKFEIVQKQAGTVTVHFLMSYKTESYADETIKELHMAIENNNWIITNERNLQVKIISI